MQMWMDNTEFNKAPNKLCPILDKALSKHGTTAEGLPTSSFIQRKAQEGRREDAGCYIPGKTE